MVVKPDQDPLNADWTKADVLDLPGGRNADDVARWLYDQQITWDRFTGYPAYDRWAVFYPWLADVPAKLEALHAADAASLEKLAADAVAAST